MADTTALKNRIRAAIKSNDNQEITGPVLQQALLDMVDELNGATETEAQQRQNGDSTLQQGINNEAQQRQNGDSTLSGMINSETQRAQEAELNLQNTKLSLSDYNETYLVLMSLAPNNHNDYSFSFGIISSTGKYRTASEAKKISFVGDGSSSAYYLSSTENSYTPYSINLDRTQDLQGYVVKVPLWQLANKDFRDLLYIYDASGKITGIPLNDEIKKYKDKTEEQAVDESLQQAIRNLRNAGYAFGGIATPEVNPNPITGNCFYIVREAGTYSYFLNADSEPIVIENDGLYIFTYESVENNYWEYNLVIGINGVVRFGSNNLITSDAAFLASVVPQIPIGNVTILRNHGYNNQGEVIPYNGLHILTIILTGKERTITALNLLMEQYRANPLFIFYDGTGAEISRFATAIADAGKWLTAYIPKNARKVDVQTSSFGEDFQKNKIIFGYTDIIDDNYFGFVMPVGSGSGIVVSDNGVINVNGLTLICANGKYCRQQVSFYIDHTSTSYLFSSTENSYTPFYREIARGNTNITPYVVKIPLWNIDGMDIDERDIIYHKSVKGGYLWPWIKDALDAKQLVATNTKIEDYWKLPSFGSTFRFTQDINADTLFKHDFIQGAKVNQITIKKGYGLGANCEEVSQPSFFITYITLTGNEKYITALNLVTLGGDPDDPENTTYSLSPMFAFWDANGDLCGRFNGTGADKGKFLTAEIPSGCRKIGVNCGRDQILSNRIIVDNGGVVVPPPTPIPDPVLNVLGDSITEQRHYTDALAALGYTINNYGISGTTISTVRQSNYFKSRVAEMTDTCDAVIVFGGINDWVLGAPLGTKFETTDESKFYPALNELFLALRNKYVDKPIFVCTPLHSQFVLQGYDSKLEYSESNNQITANAYGNGDILSKYVQAIKDVAQLYSIQVIDTYSESGMAALIPSNNTAYYKDGLHPNAAGGVLVAKCIDKYIKVLKTV